MQSKESPRARRVHGAQIKSQVLAGCRQLGASVAAVALAHGLNANLVRNWLHGRGVQRAGLKIDAVPASRCAAARASTLQFVPIGMSVPGSPMEVATAPPAPAVPATLPLGGDVIEIELRRGASQMTVRWPLAQAAQCTQWLRELSAAVLGTGERTP